MYFHNWLKRKGEYVLDKDVRAYLKGKDHPIAKTILKECEADPNVEIIPTAVWEDEFYNFKG